MNGRNGQTALRDMKMPETGSIAIRLMHEGDLDEVARIEDSIFTQPWSRKSFEDSLRLPEYLMMIAELDGMIAGYCVLVQSFDEADIVDVAVAQPFRKRGIATAMLQKLMEAGTKRGIGAFTLEVRRGNKEALALYEKLGFETAGYRKDFYEKPREDAAIMWKRLE